MTLLPRPKFSFSEINKEIKNLEKSILNKIKKTHNNNRINYNKNRFNLYSINQNINNKDYKEFNNTNSFLTKGLNRINYKKKILSHDLSLTQFGKFFSKLSIQQLIQLILNLPASTYTKFTEAFQMFLKKNKPKNTQNI
jgi:hypothetical protein